MTEGALAQVLSPLRKSQRTVIRLVVQAIASLGQAASIPIAASLAQKTSCQLDSALLRFYRLLHNARVDDLAVCRRQPEGSQKRQE